MNSRSRHRGDGLGSTLRDLQTQIRVSDIALGIKVLATMSRNLSVIPQNPHGGRGEPMPESCL